MKPRAGLTLHWRLANNVVKSVFCRTTTTFGKHECWLKKGPICIQMLQKEHKLLCPNVTASQQRCSSNPQACRNQAHSDWQQLMRAKLESLVIMNDLKALL